MSFFPGAALLPTEGKLLGVMYLVNKSEKTTDFKHSKYELLTEKNNWSSRILSGRDVKGFSF